MPKIVFLPHSDLCPDGAVVEAQEGESILNVALRSGIELELHAVALLASFTNPSHILVYAPRD